MEGFLYIDKPAGWTSFDVVNYIRRMVADIEGKKPKNIKVGHTGTLDPAATGLLVICVGKKYTSKVPELIKQDKTYEVETVLGKTSTTADIEGEITDISDRIPTEKEVLEVIAGFVGEIEQRPPAYSAVKIDGKRAYDLARAGKTFEMKPRKVKVYSIDKIQYNYPKISFESKVGSGTYIRSLSVDIGKKLGTGAYVSALKRTSIGNINIIQAVGPKMLTPETLQKSLAS